MSDEAESDESPLFWKSSQTHTHSLLALRDNNSSRDDDDGARRKKPDDEVVGDKKEMRERRRAGWRVC